MKKDFTEGLKIPDKIQGNKIFAKIHIPFCIFFSIDFNSKHCGTIHFGRGHYLYYNWNTK